MKMNRELLEKLILIAIESNDTADACSQNNIADEFIGKYVICRTYAAGVHVGVLKTYDAQTRQALLTESRRIWSWEGAFTLSEASQNGISGGRVAIALDKIMIAQIEEIIPCSALSEKTFRSKEAYKP